MIISVLNLKGGAGKTTLATCIATAFARDGKKTMLLDTDKQRSAMLWYETRTAEDKNLNVVSITEPKSIGKELPKLDEIYDIIVVDGAPNTELINRMCAAVSNLVIVPMQPCGLDMGATQVFLKSLEEAQIINDELKVLVVINRINPQASIARDTVEIMSEMAAKCQDLKYTLAETKIKNRVVYADAASTGETVLERKNPDAKKEIQNLMNEIKEIVNG